MWTKNRLGEVLTLVNKNIVVYVMQIWKKMRIKKGKNGFLRLMILNDGIVVNVQKKQSP